MLVTVGRGGVGVSVTAGHRGVSQVHFPLRQARPTSCVFFSSLSPFHSESQTSSKYYPFLCGPLCYAICESLGGEHSLSYSSLLAVENKLHKTKNMHSVKKKKVLLLSMLQCFPYLFLTREFTHVTLYHILKFNVLVESLPVTLTN